MLLSTCDTKHGSTIKHLAWSLLRPLVDLEIRLTAAPQVHYSTVVLIARLPDFPLGFESPWSSSAIFELGCRSTAFPSWLPQGSSTSILMMCFPGTTIRPRNRLVMSTFIFAVGSIDASVAALIALAMGARYS